MSAPLFTPGPWETFLQPSGRGSEWAISGAHCVLARALTIYSGGDGSAEANARLIAAAPELYEALEDLVLAGAGVHPVFGEKAKAALAKARGEQ